MKTAISRCWRRARKRKSSAKSISARRFTRRRSWPTGSFTSPATRTSTPFTMRPEARRMRCRNSKSSDVQLNRMNTVTPEAIQAAQEQLDAHLRDIIAWHFSAETGCPFWLEWAQKNFDPRKEIRKFEDGKKFPHFQ